ncbi:hypothetical protein HPG69_001040 [Diceros bicornis minor]|uniref:Uncharacterized protein n=1 Tax=Diceros bicornis minor TaxID=77932 RepID=A0A7J7E5K8_DICBM|nr:hypothetical protein HPG69_001040 [Diceros bicornis minor]
MKESDHPFYSNTSEDLPYVDHTEDRLPFCEHLHSANAWSFPFRMKTIMGMNLPAGIPVVYELDKILKYTKPMHFLGNQETLCTTMEAAAAQEIVQE